jgi:lipid-A-disaccharide synthase
MAKQSPTIALVAGEASGDQLGAALIERLRERYPGARFAGIGGKHMKAAGLEAWWDSEELALFGLVEVLSHIPRLLKLRGELTRRLQALSPDVFIGIDAPDFNLGLELRLRRSGIRTIHSVSRERRVRKISRAADLVLCLFPFEPDFYRGHGVKATYVGHPMADQIAPDNDPALARERLKLDPAKKTIALLPGSRGSEVSRLAEPMIQAARKLAAQDPALQFAAAMANEKVQALFRSAMRQSGFEHVNLVSSDPRGVIAAADVVMCASGTVALETLLVNRPMVVTYRISPATYYLAKYLKLIRPQLFSLPNILAGEKLVPELIQHESTAENLARQVRKWLDSQASRESLKVRFLQIHERLCCDASKRAADAVSGILES